MSYPTVHIGLIGCGHVAHDVHLEVLSQMPEAQVVALADTDEQQLNRALQLAPDATPFSDYHDLIAQSEAEAVLICLPTALHAEAAVAALEAQTHVYVEKPLAAYLDEAATILDAWCETDVVGMMGFNYRFNPLYQNLRQQLRDETMGPACYARSIFSTPAGAEPTWKRQRQSGGGVLLDFASHHIDLVRFLFGDEIQAVTAEVFSRYSEDDTATVQMALHRGITVQSYFSLHGIEEDSVEIICERGTLSVDRLRSLAVERIAPEAQRARISQMRHGIRTLTRVPYVLQKLRSPWNEPSYQTALSRFIEAIQTGSSDYPDLDDGYRSLAVIDAAERSARSGRVVSVQYDRATPSPTRLRTPNEEV